jgi:hypothetical protein
LGAESFALFAAHGARRATVHSERPMSHPFPHEAVRDLLGIARAMYAVEQDVARKAELADIGKSLRDAADLARKAPPDSLGGKAAMKRAEDATNRLCAVVAGDVLKLVHATAGRVRRG